jgi:hypothetical protein
MTLPVAGVKGCGPLGWAGRLAYAVDADRTVGGDMRKPSAAASDDETRAKTLTLSVQTNNQPNQSLPNSPFLYPSQPYLVLGITCAHVKFWNDVKA